MRAFNFDLSSHGSSACSAKSISHFCLPLHAVCCSAHATYCGVRKGTGRQSVVVCAGKYPGGKGPGKAVGYVHSYWQSGVLCTPALAVLRVCV